MTQKNEIKAVLFDLGDTLLDFGHIDKSELFEKSSKRTYEYLSKYDGPVAPYLFYKYRSIISIYTHLLKTKLTGKDFDAFELLKKINRKNGINLSEQQWQELAWLWYEPLSEIAKVEAGLSETLSGLKQRGLKLGIVSNTFVPRVCLDRHLRELGLVDYFDFQLYSCEYYCRKPNWDIFVEAANKIGARLPEIVFVGDRIDKDIKPSLSLEMTPVLKIAYTNYGKRVPEGARSVHRLGELLDIIDELNSDSE